MDFFIANDLFLLFLFFLYNGFAFYRIYRNKLFIVYCLFNTLLHNYNLYSLKWIDKRGLNVIRLLHCVKSVHIHSFSGLYLVQMWENTDRKNTECGHFLHIVVKPINIDHWYNHLFVPW